MWQQRYCSVGERESVTGEERKMDRRRSHCSIPRNLGLTQEQTEYVRRAFNRIDTNGNGLISREELEQASRVLGYNLSRREVARMIASVDQDGNGQIDLKEFAVMMRDQFGALEYQELALRDAFRTLDKAGRGYIDCQQLRSLLLHRGDSLSDQEFQRVVEELDVNRDGKIHYEELSRKMCSFPKLDQN